MDWASAEPLRGWTWTLPVPTCFGTNLIPPSTADTVTRSEAPLNLSIWEVAEEGSRVTPTTLPWVSPSFRYTSEEARVILVMAVEA